jgi:hypothetical protein
MTRKRDACVAGGGRTETNSKRVAADLEVVFSKTAAVVSQVKAVTARVREVAAGGAGDHADPDDDGHARRKAQVRKADARRRPCPARLVCS